MKTLTTLEEVRKVLADLVKTKAEGNELGSARGQYCSFECKFGTSTMKSTYYAKNQEDKSDKNPFWGEPITFIKKYEGVHFGDTYTPKAETTNAPTAEYVSLVPNLLFELKGNYYVQVQKHAYSNTICLNGTPLTAEQKEVLDRYKKPYKGREDDVPYKKIRLDHIERMTIRGEVYAINLNASTLTVATTANVAVTANA